MDSLWPDVEPDAARHSLQVAVSSLRKMMPDRPATGIARQGDAYQLEMSPDAFSDVRSFQVWLASAASAMSRGDHQRALDAAVRAAEVYRGDLLLDEGPADWVCRSSRCVAPRHGAGVHDCRRGGDEARSSA
jgi:DNA-binding SARP family transcriptional activator